MTAPAASVTIAALALIIGLFNLWYSVIRPWRRSRWANATATLELLTYPTGKEWETDERVVVTNVGPAEMRNVTAEVRDREGAEFPENIRELWPTMPLPVVYPGQALHLKLSLGFSELPPASVVLRWKDGRSGVQERKIWLSYQRIT